MSLAEADAAVPTEDRNFRAPITTPRYSSQQFYAQAGSQSVSIIYDRCEMHLDKTTVVSLCLSLSVMLHLHAGQKCNRSRCVVFTVNRNDAFLNAYRSPDWVRSIFFLSRGTQWHHGQAQVELWSTVISNEVRSLLLSIKPLSGAWLKLQAWTATHFS